MKNYDITDNDTTAPENLRVVVQDDDMKLALAVFFETMNDFGRVVIAHYGADDCTLRFSSHPSVISEEDLVDGE